MKKIFAILTILAAFTFVGCVKQTEFSSDSLPVKCVVTGYVKYTSHDGNNSSTTALPVGTEVRVLYAIPSESKVDYAVTTTTIDNSGCFRVDLGCPAGQALKVKCETSFVATHYISVEGSGTISNQALFYGCTEEKTIAAGAASHFIFEATRQLNLTYPDTK